MPMDLGDGLVIRSATSADVDRLAEFCSEVFKDEPSGTEAYWIAEWMRDLLTKPHPTLNTDDVMIVEDVPNNRIASTTTYMSQTLSYDGVKFEIGRPEIVGSASEYRNRGLIRKQFEIMHRWGDERGHLAQIIDGIPTYYRQFGYEYAIANVGGRYAPIQSFPSWGKDEKRPFRLRDAIDDDIPYITRILNDSAQRSLVSPVFREDEVRHLTFNRTERSAVCHQTSVLCQSDGETLGEPVGVLMYAMVVPIDEGVMLRVEMTEPKFWREATRSLLCEIRELAQIASDKDPDPEREIKRIRQDMQPDHPIYMFDDGALGDQPERQYAWYVRVPDITKFLQEISPVLERKLEASLHRRFSGAVNLRIDNDLVSISVDDGVITEVSSKNAVHRATSSGGWHDATGRFTTSTFLPVLFGMRSVTETVLAHIDANTNSKSDRHLLETLFPKRTSDLSLTLT